LDEASLWILKETVEKEARKAMKEGFYPLDVGGELKKAEGFIHLMLAVN